MWETDDFYTAKLVVWGWAKLEQGPCSVVTGNQKPYGCVVGGRDGALYVAKPDDEMPTK